MKFEVYTKKNLLFRACLDVQVQNSIGFMGWASVTRKKAAWTRLKFTISRAFRVGWPESYRDKKRPVEDFLLILQDSGLPTPKALGYWKYKPSPN